MLEQLFNSPFLYSLSLTLVHFLWQGLLVALILKSALFIIDKNKSKLRYTLATFAMLANAVLAILTFSMVYPDTSAGINSNLSPIPLTSLVNELTQQNALLSYQELVPSILAYSLPYLSLLWLASVSILAAKLLIEVRNVNNLPMHSSVLPSSELLLRFDELAKQIKLTKTPKLLISLKAEVPMAIGWLKPVVLLPASMVTGLDSAQLEMLILHELAHIRRHDYLVNFLQTLVELLFFFHPSVHWIGKQMRNEREYCSDDIAVQHCGDAIAYAHTLTDTASLCAKDHFHTIPTMAMAASGGDLKARVLRLVDHHCAPTNNTSKWLAAMSLLLALTLLSINQLLTAPFAQQLNNQFPWQENGFTPHTLFQAKPATVDVYKTGSDAVSTSLINDSIAQQLLSRKADISSISLPRLEQANTTTEFSLNNKKALSTATIEPEIITSKTVAMKSTTKATPTSSQPVTSPQSKLARTKLADNSIKLTSGEISNQAINTQQKLAVIESTKVLDTKNSKLNVHNKAAKKLIGIPPQTQEKMQAIQSVQLAQLKSELTDVTVYQKAKPQLTAQFDNKLMDASSPYQQLSYQQEINELSAYNKLYQASNAQSSALNQTREEQKFASHDVFAVPSLEAKLLKSISPVYPSLAKRRGIEMEVKVNFTIDRSGKVKDIIFTQQSKLVYFKSAIRSAIRKWRFSPATKNNQTIESKMTKIFSFSLQA